MLSLTKSRLSAFVVLACLALAATAFAAGADELPPAQQSRYEALCDKLIAPCCWSEPIRVHRSEVSLQMRTEVAAMIRAGKSDAEIVDGYVQRYGQRVLVLPEGGKRQWLFWIPVVAVAFGLFALLLVLRRLRAPQGQQAAVSAGPTVDIKDSDLEW